MKIKIIANDKANPPGKLADVELHFTQDTDNAIGALAGLKLIGFAIWETRGSGGRRNVTFPARQYSVNGERRSFALLRPIVDTTAQNRIRDLILEAYREYEAQAAQDTNGGSTEPDGFRWTPNTTPAPAVKVPPSATPAEWPHVANEAQEPRKEEPQEAPAPRPQAPAFDF